MKIVLSIPDEILEGVRRVARRRKKSFEEVISAALREYLARHDQDGVTEAINRALDDIEDPSDKFADAAARRILERTEW